MLVVALLLAAALDDAQFTNPSRVTIAGYSDDAMEPFVTGQEKGSYLKLQLNSSYPAAVNL